MSSNRPAHERLAQQARNAAINEIVERRPVDRERYGKPCGSCGEVLPGDMWGLICECERAEAARLIRDYCEDLDSKGKFIEEVLEASEVPERFWDADFKDFEQRPGTEAAFATVKRWADSFTPGSREGFLLAGSFGSGKTHLAVAALHAVMIRTLVSGLFVSAGGLVARVRAGEGKRFLDYEPVERAIAAELLLLDDVGQECGTEFARDVVARVVMGRYDAARPTIFTSNQGPKGMEEALGGAVVSRMVEMGKTIGLLTTDYRQLRKRA